MDTKISSKDNNSSQGHWQLDKWLFDKVSLCLKGRILEMNSNDSILHSCFITNNIPIHLSSTNADHCAILFEKYRNISSIRQIHKIDFKDLNFQGSYSPICRVFDTILLMNMKPNLPIDQITMQNAKSLLAERGRLIFLSPGHTTLFHGIHPDWNDLIRNDPHPLKKWLFNEFEVLRIRYLLLQHPESIIPFDPILPYLFFVGRKK